MKRVPYLDPIDKDLAIVPLTHNAVSVIDSADFSLVKDNQWSLSYHGYAMRAIRVKDKIITILLHRILMDAPIGLLVDHIDGNPLNNRRSNLRLCSQAENCRNSKKPSSGLSSFYKGVYRDKRTGKWVARIRDKGPQINLGSFLSEEDAAKAYDKAAILYHRDFARLNFSQANED